MTVTKNDNVKSDITPTTAPTKVRVMLGLVPTNLPPDSKLRKDAEQLKPIIVQSLDK
jgi:hypothetical protein